MRNAFARVPVCGSDEGLNLIPLDQSPPVQTDLVPSHHALRVPFLTRVRGDVPVETDPLGSLLHYMLHCISFS